MTSISISSEAFAHHPLYLSKYSCLQGTKELGCKQTASIEMRIHESFAKVIVYFLSTAHYSPTKQQFYNEEIDKLALSPGEIGFIFTLDSLKSTKDITKEYVSQTIKKKLLGSCEYYIFDTVKKIEYLCDSIDSSSISLSLSDVEKTCLIGIDLLVKESFPSAKESNFSDYV